MTHLPRILLVLLLAVMCVSAWGCNAVEGMGRDIERAGEAIQDAAR